MLFFFSDERKIRIHVLNCWKEYVKERRRKTSLNLQAQRIVSSKFLRFVIIQFENLMIKIVNESMNKLLNGLLIRFHYQKSRYAVID